MATQPLPTEAEAPREECGPEQPFNCARHGSFIGRVSYVWVGGRRLDFDPSCATCEAEDEARRRHEQAQREADETRRRTEARMVALGVPVRFRGATFDNYEAPAGSDQAKVLRTVRLYCERFDTRRKVGSGLMLIGRPGTGKTHLLCAAALALHGRCQPLYTDAWSMIAAIKASWARSAKEDEASVIARFVAPDLLLIDEIGVQYGTDAERALLHRVIDLRYQQLKPTIAAGNVDLNGMKAYLGERAVSRLQDGDGVVLTFGWDDYRTR